MGQATTRFFFFFKYCVFVLFFSLYMFPQKIKNWMGVGVWVSGQSEFFSDFWNLFNLTKPLSANHDNSHFVNVLSPYYIAAVRNEMDI